MSLPVIIITAVLMLTTGLGGFVLGRYKSTPYNVDSKTASKVVTPKEKVANPETVKLVETSTLFKSQTANFLGTITKINGNTATTKDKDGKESTFPFSPNLSIYKFGADPNKPERTTDPKTIELDKQASIVLEFRDTQYTISSITYLPSVVPQVAAPLTPAASPKTATSSAR